MSEEFKMEFELLQPWSTFVMKTKLPPPILKKMIRITDEIVADNAHEIDNPGAGQLKDQFLIKFEILEREELMEFFLDVCKNYVIQAFCQAQPDDKEMILKDHWTTHLTSMWGNSQKDNEYFPVHVHSNCALSASMYLKIPEYLPSRRNEINYDGAVTFENNTSQDHIWASTPMMLQPKVGDFFIFPASQQHQVYPFRTPDGKSERRSVSFNAGFKSPSCIKFK
jgi:hypothetical protein